ncbi:MAG: VWA domain-containing protein [Bacteroidales bacterium]
MALATLAARTDATQQQQPLFRAGVRTVAVYATVTDADGHLVPDLDKSAFRVLDNGRCVDISTFSNDPQPITVAIMLDMSGSMMARVIRVREATDRFIDAVEPGDRVRLGTFGNEVAISPLLTDDRQLLRRVLLEELWPGGGTPLWRALLAAMTSLQGGSGRRVVLVLTDGRDTDPVSPQATVGEVRRRAVAGGFMVYAIGMERSQGGERVTVPNAIATFTSVASGGLSPDMINLARETGGGHFELKSDSDLAATFARVATELRHQYLLGFSPAVIDGRVHKLEVQVIRPGCAAQARKSYVAQETK